MLDDELIAMLEKSPIGIKLLPLVESVHVTNPITNASIISALFRAYEHGVKDTFNDIKRVRAEVNHDTPR